MPYLIPETWETFTFELQKHSNLATLQELRMANV
jgi:hypothetical protein